MVKSKIKFILLLSTLSIISACSNIKTEPADDGYNSRPRNGGDGWGEKTQDDKDRFLNRQIAKILKKGNSKKTDKDIKARLERLERQQSQGSTQVQPAITNSSDITAPPIGATRRSPNTNSTNWQNSTSYQEWKLAKEGGSSDYKEFQEYKEWLEFKKLKEQSK